MPGVDKAHLGQGRGPAVGCFDKAVKLRGPRNAVSLTQYLLLKRNSTLRNLLIAKTKRLWHTVYNQYRSAGWDLVRSFISARPVTLKPLNPELNPICYLLALL